MNHTRRPQYLDVFLLMQLGDLALTSVQAARRAWWFSIGLVLLVFFFGLVLTDVIR